MARIERGAPISAERGGGRGRRDPVLRDRIARDEPVYDDETPDGEVRVRGPQQAEPAAPEDAAGGVINLDELSDEEYAELVERGLINDGDSGEIEIDMAELVDDEEQLNDYQMLSPSAVIYAKVHHPVRFDGDEPSNFSYGIADHLLDGETEEEAFERISLIVNTRALNLAQAATEPVMQFKDEVHKARKAAIDKGRALRPRPAEEKS